MNKKHWLCGFLDSVVMSGSGFLVNLLSGRYLSIEHYGIYITLFTLGTLSLVIQAALVSNPYTVILQHQEGLSRSLYILGTLGLTLALGCSLGVISAIGILGTLPHSEVSVFLLFILYILGNLVQDFLRRHYYATRQETQALILDVLSYGGQVALIVVIGHQLTLQNLFVSLVGTTWIALALNIVLNGKLLIQTLKSAIQDEKIKTCILLATQKNWEFGKWLLLSNGLSWVASQLYLLVLSVIQPPQLVAQIGAARTIPALSNPVVMAYEAVGTPAFSRLFKQGGMKQLKPAVYYSALAGGLIFLAIGFGVFLFPLQTVQLIFGKSFGDISLLLRLFSVLPCLWFASKVFSIALLASQRSKELLKIYAISCGWTLTAGLMLTILWGNTGTAIGLIINALILTAGFGLQFGQAQAERASTEKCLGKAEASS